MNAQQSKRDATESTVLISFRASQSLRKELKIIAAKEDVSLNLLLEDVIKNFVKNYKSKKKSSKKLGDAYGNG